MNYFLSSMPKENWANHAGYKATADVEKIFEKHNLKKFNQNPIFFENKKTIFGVLFAIMQRISVSFKLRTLKGHMIFIQYPYPPRRIPDAAVIRAIRRNKACLVVHDIASIRNDPARAEKEVFEHAEYIISHNPKMTEKLLAMTDNSEIINLNIFDYLTDNINTCERQKNDGIVFAGNLNSIKAGFLYEYGKNSTDFTLNLYGMYLEEDKITNDKLQFKGCFDPEELIQKIEGSFGLIWDGNSCTTCSGRYGEYLRYNNPHKTSLYIIAGLPIIVWSEAAMADFVLKNNIGIVVDSLIDLPSVINNITDEQYNEMHRNVLVLAKSLMNGDILGNIIDDILSRNN
ncbi:MAG: hypothetical protein LBF12_00455 [Christensenellaceae bacterium]|nr:hypothetical protein [Christensenellaceae bacterium]